MGQKHHAPKLEAYWNRFEGQLLTMLRDDWNGADYPLGQIVRIDLSNTPLSALADKAEFIGAVAKRISQNIVEILAYRHDPKDSPNAINVYRYFAHEAFPAGMDLEEMVNKASTRMDTNLQGYLGETVFFTYGMLPFGQHHIADIPQEVRDALGLPEQ